MNKWGKRIGIVFLIPIVLLLLISLLLYLPFVQDTAVRTASRMVGKATGMDIGIEQIRLSFPLRLKVKNVQIIAQSDTMLDMGKLEVDIHPWPLLRKEVQIRSINLEQVTADTRELIDGFSLKGKIGRLYTHTDWVKLSNETARIKEILLSDAAVTVIVSETAEDPVETSEPMQWKLGIDKVQLDRVALAMQLPDDSLRLATYIDGAGIKDGKVDLGRSVYKAVHFFISRSSLLYDSGSAEPIAGFDSDHIQLDSLNLQLDSICYAPRNISGRIREWSARERSGLAIDSVTGHVFCDKENIHIPEIRLQTTSSSIRTSAEIPWSSLQRKASGEMKILLSGDFGKEDLFLFAPTLPEDFKRAFPEQSSFINARISGNMEQLHIDSISGEVPQLLTLSASGELSAVADSAGRTGDMRFNVTSRQTDLPLAFLPPAERDNYIFPSLSLEGKLSIDRNLLNTEMVLSESTGKVRLLADYDMKAEEYHIELTADSIEPVHFMPNDSLYWVEAGFKAEGQGLDIYSPATRAKIDGKIDRIRYGKTSLSNITAQGELKMNNLQFKLVSRYPLAKMDISLNGNISQSAVTSMLVADVEHIDLKGLHLTDVPLATSFQLFAEAKSNMKMDHTLDVSLGNWELKTKGGVARPKILTLHADTDKDTTLVSFHVGDLDFMLHSHHPLADLSQRFSSVGRQLEFQLKKDSTLTLESIRPLLPDVQMKLTAHRDNPLYHLLRTQNILFTQLDVQASTSPGKGLLMDADLLGLMQDTTRIDSICFKVEQDTLGLAYKGTVTKRPFRKQMPFTATIGGRIDNRHADINVEFLNKQGEKGFLFGARVDKVEKGFDLHFYPEHPILAFRTFTINKENYIHYESLKNITADVWISSKDNTSIRLYTLPTDMDMNGLNIELNQLDLGYLSGKFSNLPSMGGKMNTAVQYQPSDSSFMFIAETHIDTLVYDNDPVGELLLNGIYLPVSKEEHQIDIHLFHNGQEISTATAFYKSGLKDYIDGQLSITDLPLSMMTPFIPDDMAELSGRMQGEVTVKGNPGAPEADGFFRMEEANAFVTATGSSFRFDTASIDIKKNVIYFNHYDVYAFGDNPFVLNGKIDGNNLSALRADLTMKASNMEVFNVKRSHKNMVYGKLLVNLNSTLKGPLSALKMRGDLQLLGGTNATYVLQDSPLTVQDRLASLVTFTDFSDTLLMHRKKPEVPLPIKGLDMLMTIRVDQSVRLNADITPDQSSRVELEGGGDLSFQYTPQGDMILNGKYTLTGGMVKYAMPIIPLKEFNIRQGSYISWNGPVMDPYLNLTATERVRASVSQNKGSSRMTNFDVGVSLKDRLENLKFQFILNAPEDQNMQQELARMGESERSQIAVTMLVTGMYLNLNDMSSLSSGSKGLDMGNALNSFLQSEINNIAGSALKSVDISLGMEQYDQDNTAGGQRTDFSFRFAKRFYNDRISIILGGRVSTGQNINNGQAQPFIDNASIEYRLDNSGTRYIKLFHDKNYESLLEGEITETGFGVVLRKKMLHLRELFIFRKNKNKAVKEYEKKK